MSKYSASKSTVLIIVNGTVEQLVTVFDMSFAVGNKTTFLINNKANIVWSPFNCVYGMMWNQTPYKPTKYILWFTSLTPNPNPNPNPNPFSNIIPACIGNYIHSQSQRWYGLSLGMYY